MSQGLLTQLAEYGAYCEERQGSVTADDVIGDVVRLPEPAKRPQPRRGWLAAAAAVMAGLLIGGVAWLTRANSESVDSSVAASDVLEATDVATLDGCCGHIIEAGDAVWIIDGESIVLIDGTSLEPTGRIPIGPIHGQGIKEIAVSGDAVWVVSLPATVPRADSDRDEPRFRFSTVRRIDIATGRVTDTFEVEFAGGFSAYAPRLLNAGGGLWVSHAAGFDRIDLGTRQVDSIVYPQENRNPETPWGQGWLGEFGGALWLDDVYQEGPRRLTRIDLETHQVEEYRVPFNSPPNLTFSVLADGAVWFVEPSADRVGHFDLESRELTVLPSLGHDLWAGYYIDGAIWLPSLGGPLTRIDASTLDVTDRIPLDNYGEGPIVTDDGSLWIATGGEAVSRIDMATRQVTHVVDLGDLPNRLLASNGALWVMVGGDEFKITRIEYP